MVTLFAVPKAFEGEADVAQRNALGSWVRLQPAARVLLFGNAPGIAEAAGEYGAEHVPDVETTRFGTPLLHSVFRQANVLAGGGRLCYVNADIVFLDDLPRTISRIRTDRFLLTGRRRELLPNGLIDFDSPGWDACLREQSRDAPLMHPFGSDYFVFAAGRLFAEIPPFAVGRPAWDNWMIYRARTHGLAVLDATRAITALHPTHGYTHMPRRRDGRWENPETDDNRALAVRELGGPEIFHLRDATHVVTPDRIRPVHAPLRLWRRARNRRAYARARLAEKA